MKNQRIASESGLTMLLEVEDRLRFNHRNLVGIGRESMDMQLGFTGLEINVTEGLESVDYKLGEPDKHAAVTPESFEVGKALPVYAGTEAFDLKISHIADAFAESAFVRAGAAKLEPLDKPAFGQRLCGGAYDLGKSNIPGEYADDMRASRDPYQGLVFFGFELPACVNIEEFRVQRSLKQAEG